MRAANDRAAPPPTAPARPTAPAPELAGDEVGDLRLVTDARTIVSVLADFIVADLIRHPRLDE